MTAAKNNHTSQSSFINLYQIAPGRRADFAPQRRRLSRRLLAMAVAVAAFTSQPAWSRGPATDVTPQLEALNQNFRALYRARTRQVAESLPLVLVVQNSTITAVRGNHRRLYAVPLERYNQARAVVHAALGFHGLMNQLAAAAPGQANWQGVDAFLHDVEQARRNISLTSLSKEEKALATQLLNLVGTAARDAKKAGSVKPETVTAVMRQAEPLLTRISLSIGRAHAGAMLNVLDRVRANATDDEWQKAVAVVTGPMTPRRNNLETAVVAAALGAELLGERIFYSENIFSVDGALAYLQTVMGDRELSQNVFGNPNRMWEDLFAPVSMELLGQEFYTELGR